MEPNRYPAASERATRSPLLAERFSFFLGRHRGEAVGTLNRFSQHQIA